MNTPLQEIQRLREQLAEKDRQMRDLRALVSAHLEATSDDPELALRREQAAYELGRQHGDDEGWRRGAEHALMAVEDAHLQGDPHDHHGQMRELGLHDGPVPRPKTPDEIVADAEDYGRRQAEWWWREYGRSHPEADSPGNVRQIRPRQAEREAI